MNPTNLQIKVVENTEEQMKAFLIRGIVYMHEQNCPYEEEFDQNDFTSTQIIGLIGQEPVLTARIRYFQGFAKLERLAVRPQFRGHQYGHRLLRFMMQLCKDKGFSTIYLHANRELISFYESYGFRCVRGAFAFSDYDYVEMVLELTELEVATVSLNDSPHVLNRPEGKWQIEGPIEKSLERSLEARKRLMQ